MDDFHKVGGKVKEVQEDFQASSKDIYKEKTRYVRIPSRLMN